MISTKSPIFSCSDLSNHFLRSINVDKYSRNQRLQTAFENACASFHCLRVFIVSQSYFASGISPDDEPKRKWLGVSASLSRGSTGTCVNGRELMACSISANTMRSTSSVGACSRRPICRDDFTDLNNLSQAHPYAELRED